MSNKHLGDDEEVSLETLRIVKKDMILSEIASDYPDTDFDNLPADQLSREDRLDGILRIVIAESLFEIERKVEDLENEIERELEEVLSDPESFDEKYRELLFRTKLVENLSYEFIFYISLISEYMKTLSIEVLESQLIEEKYQGTNKTERMLENLSQPQREQLMLRTGIIDESLNSELSHVREVRNDMMHDFHERLLFRTVDDVLTETDRAYSALQDLETYARDDLESITFTREF
ncbi:hypothetical protein [Halapricum desulfuricans]|uniref:hypothetical protein n=1 Tax=Halapricum desulfuricans TaxID=2841257 RepID=UPI001E618A79|nr:hypothetical protein [Halapricum desulfuricans]